MMLHPTIADLTKGKINRYELAVATAKCARSLNNDYVAQKELAEKAALAGKDADFVVTIDQELADVKPVRVAIDRIYAGKYRIIQAEEAARMAEARADAAESAE
jgi:DNA-directed RNA polymerase omega subunit